MTELQICMEFMMICLLPFPVIFVNSLCNLFLEIHRPITPQHIPAPGMAQVTIVLYGTLLCVIFRFQCYECQLWCALKEYTCLGESNISYYKYGVRRKFMKLTFVICTLFNFLV